jgi:hypothetical protein
MVTVVVTVMSIFCKKKCKLWSANPGNEKPFCQKVEIANFFEENSLQIKKPVSENEERPVIKEIRAK